MKMRINHLKTVAEQDNRVQKLNHRLEENHLQTAKLKQELFSLEQNLFELEKKLQLFQKQRQNLMDIGESGDKYTAQIDEAEAKGLELLDGIDTHEKELQELRNFEVGLQKTISEISSEVAEQKTLEIKAIDNIIFRISALEEELPSQFKSVFKMVQSKNLAHGPFTRNDNGFCYFCRYKISRIDESEIDLQQQLKQCPQCSRIFLPYGC